MTKSIQLLLGALIAVSAGTANAYNKSDENMNSSKPKGCAGATNRPNATWTDVAEAKVTTQGARVLPTSSSKRVN